MNVSVESPFRSLRSPVFLQIKQRIGIKVGAENTEPSFGDAWILEALEFVTQREVALLRRVEVGKPPGWIPCPGGFSQCDAGVGDAGRCENEPRDVRRRHARPARLRGVGDHGRSHGCFGFGNRICVKIGTKIARQCEGGQVEAVVAAPARVVRASLAQRWSGRFRSPRAVRKSAWRRRRRSRRARRASRLSPEDCGDRHARRAATSAAWSALCVGESEGPTVGS